MNRVHFFILTFVSGVVICACENSVDVTENVNNVIPDHFKVDIPSSLSNNLADIEGRTKEDSLPSGREIYEHLNYFIHVAEEASAATEEIIQSIYDLDIEEAVSFTYESEADNRSKNIDISEGFEFDDRVWDYAFTVTDAASNAALDSGYAIQVFWNNRPLEGIAILKPYNVDRVNTLLNLEEVVYRIEYSEADENYDASMCVSIVGLPETDSRYWMNKIKMFVGKKEDLIEVYGSSVHPNAYLFEDNRNDGISWSFAAVAAEYSNIAVAEVGLPPASLNSDIRKELLEVYAIKEVFTDELTSVYEDTISDEDLEVYLEDTDAPGFFNKNGFIQSGTAPFGTYSELEEAILTLKPFNPSKINKLSISFNN